jgi:hypothetical protein
MADLKQLAQDFLTTLASNGPARYEAVLHEDAGMRLNRWDGCEVYRPRSAVWADWRAACWLARRNYSTRRCCAWRTKPGWMRWRPNTQQNERAQRLIQRWWPKMPERKTFYTKMPGCKQRTT